MLLSTDIDECERGLDNCDVNADCTNSIGSLSCTCVQGYSGDGVTCSEFNHCTFEFQVATAQEQC